MYPAQSQKSITILGTVHKQTKYVNADTIYKIISQVEPDIILYDTDTSLYSRVKTDTSDIGIEAVRRYLEANPGTALKAIGYAGAKEFHKANRTAELTDSLQTDISNLLDRHLLDSGSVQTIVALNDFHEVVSRLSDQPLQTINSDLAYKLIEKWQEYQYDRLQKIIDNTPALRKYSDFFKQESQFRIERNHAIASSAYQFITQRSCQTAIIITGTVSKPFVRQAFARYVVREKNFDWYTKEYWE